MTVRTSAHTAIIALFCSAALSGCNAIHAWTFQEAKESGVGEGMVMMDVLPGSINIISGRHTEELNKKYIRTYKNVTKAYQKCDPSIVVTDDTDKSYGVVATTLFPVLGKLFVDNIIDRQTQALEKLKKRSMKSYSATISITHTELGHMVRNKGCLVLHRLSTEHETQLVAVLMLKPLPNGTNPTAFAFQPIYVAAHSARAITKPDTPPAISAAFAMALRGMGRQNNGLPIFAPIGEASATVPELPLGETLGENGERCLNETCPMSDPIPLYTASDPVTLTVAVAEQGDVGIDFDAAEVELKAIKEAMGPAVKDVLKEMMGN